MRRETVKKRERGDKYHMKLFVAGDDRNSRMARETLQHICETMLKGDYTLEIIDVLQDFETALEYNVLVAPTLIITSTQPPITIIGSLGETNKVLKALGLSKREERP